MQPSAHPTQLAIRPTSITLYLRRCLPWQLLRFVIINLRMTVMILKSHHTRLTNRTSERNAEREPAPRP